MTMYKILHKYYEDCFTNGEFDRDKVISKGLIDQNYNTDYRLGLLESIYKIVLEASFNNDMSIYYLTHSSKTFDDCVKEHNRLSGEDLNIKTGRSRMIYCSRKINEIFEELEFDHKNICIIEWLFNKKCFMGIDSNETKVELKNDFINQLNKFNDLYGEKISIGRKDIAISLPSCEKKPSLSEEKFNNFMDIIRPYSREYMRHIQEEVNSMLDEVGYVKYLLSPKSELTDTDKERKNIILRWLGKPEIISDNTYSTETEYSNEELSIENIDNTYVDKYSDEDGFDDEGVIF